MQARRQIADLNKKQKNTKEESQGQRFSQRWIFLSQEAKRGLCATQAEDQEHVQQHQQGWRDAEKFRLRLHKTRRLQWKQGRAKDPTSKIARRWDLQRRYQNASSSGFLPQREWEWWRQSDKERERQQALIRWWLECKAQQIVVVRWKRPRGCSCPLLWHDQPQRYKWGWRRWGTTWKFSCK